MAQAEEARGEGGVPVAEGLEATAVVVAGTVEEGALGAAEGAPGGGDSIELSKSFKNYYIWSSGVAVV